MIDSTYGEQCDDGNMTSGDGCSSTCQTEVLPACNDITISPTSVTDGGAITYTCSGTNAASYFIMGERPNNTQFATSTSAAGSLILPAGQPAGTYKISCFVTGTNGQVVTSS